MDEVHLAEVVTVPWFQPPLKISVRHALTQAAMHSHYHRGQNATRLRELGGVPPGTDLNTADSGWAPRWLSEPALRRRTPALSARAQ